MYLVPINWITQLLLILSEIPATFEYIDLDFRLSAPAIGFMQALRGVFCRFVAPQWQLYAGTPQNPLRSVVVPPTSAETTPDSARMPINAGILPVFSVPAKTIVSDFAPICKTNVKT